MKPAKKKVGAVRWTIRWCRWVGYLVVIALGFSLAYLNQVGVPDLLKRPLLGQLRERGIDLGFRRMRVRLTRGLVAENVTLSRTRAEEGEAFRAGEVQLQMHWGALLEFRAPEIVALRLRNGRVILPLPAGDTGESNPFEIEDVQATLRFVSADLWELDELMATCHGGVFHAHGVLTNASVLRSRRPARTNAPAATAVWRRQLRDVERWLDRTRFETPPEVTLAFQADARNPARTTGEFRLTSMGASNVLGELTGVSLLVRVEPGAARTRAGAEAVEAGEALVAEVELKADRAVTRWGGFDSLRVGLDAEWVGSNAVPARVDWSLESGPTTTRWAALRSLDAEGSLRPVALPAGVAAPFRLPPTNAPWAMGVPAMPGFDSIARLRGTGVVIQTRTNPVTLGSADLVLTATHTTSDWRALRLALEVEGATSAWATVPGVLLDVGLTPRVDPPASSPDWAFWQPLTHVDAWATVSLGPSRLPRLDLDGADLGIVWSAPDLHVTPLDARLGNGEIRATAHLDVSTRRAEATATSTTDPHAVVGWMGPKAREQVMHYGWRSNSLPHLEGQVGITLPHWGVPDAEERQAILRSVKLDAWLNVTNATFRGMPVDTASGRLTYTNRYWRIGPLAVLRPEGRLDFDYENDEYTKEYVFHLESTIDPFVARSLVQDEKALREIDRIVLPVPPRIVGELRGRWESPELMGARVHVTLTNATVRGEPFEWADGDVTYTNKVVTFGEVRVKSDGDVYIPGARLSFEDRLLSFTNSRATIPVYRVTRLISEKVAAFMDAYQFARPPKSFVHGTVGLHGFEGTNIRFDVDAEEFGWWKLKGTNIGASVLLKGETLSIERLHTGFYGGLLDGDLHFDWSGVRNDATYRLDLAVTNVSLREMLADMWPKTNRLEGRITGRGRVTSAVTSDYDSITGSGAVAMQDGFLWGLPIFGLFSPLFDSISPGLGQTRFTQGTADFGMTNGLIVTRNLEMRSPTMRLQYRGSVGWEGDLDATMEAELFRDAPLIGRILSFAFTPVTKLFEYRVKGTLGDPKPEPRYIPKLLLNLFRPIQTLKGLLPKGEKPDAEGEKN